MPPPTSNRASPLHAPAAPAAHTSSPRARSLHKHAPGFFPGTGACGAGGEGAGRGFALNLALGDGLRDGLFLSAYAELAGGAAAAFRPEAVVLQWCVGCGRGGRAGAAGRAFASGAAAG